MFEYNIKIIRVLDGDTIEADVDLGFNIHKYEILRLKGINAPEIHASSQVERDKAVTALQYLHKFIPMKCKVQTDKAYSTDKYGRWLGTIFYRLPDMLWKNLNEEMIAQGYAVSYDGGKR